MYQGKTITVYSVGFFLSFYFLLFFLKFFFIISYWWNISCSAFILDLEERLYNFYVLFLKNQHLFFSDTELFSIFFKSRTFYSGLEYCIKGINHIVYNIYGEVGIYKYYIRYNDDFMQGPDIYKHVETFSLIKVRL